MGVDIESNPLLLHAMDAYEGPWIIGALKALVILGLALCLCRYTGTLPMRKVIMGLVGVFAPLTVYHGFILYMGVL